MTQNHKENGIFILLGVLPIIALTDTTLNALGIGFVTLIVLFFSGIVFLLFTKFLKEPSRSFVLIIIVGTVTTIVRELLSYRLPELFTNLNIFLSLISINSFVLYHLKHNSSQKSGLEFLFLSMKRWFVIVCLVFIVSIFREILGKGTLFSRPILGSYLETKSFLLVNTPFGALIITAVVFILFYLLRRRTNG